MLESFAPVKDTGYFGNKKTIVMYVLSVLVFWIHISTFYNYDQYPLSAQFIIGFVWIVSNKVAVPLFFILSAALFYRNYTPAVYVKKLKSRVKTLLIPYFCWNLLMMLFQVAATLFFSRYFIGRVPFEFTLKGILEGFLHYKYNNPFWFVFVLMVFAVFAPVFDCILRNKYIAISAVGILWWLSNEGIGLPEPMFFDRTCIIYYLIGGILGRYYWDWFTSPSGKKQRIAGLVCLLLGWAFEYGLYFGFLYDILRVRTWHLVGIKMITAFGFWSCADWICEKVKARNFMEHSFWVYGMHMNVSAVFTKLIYLICPKHWAMALPNFFVTTVLTLAVVELTCVLLQKYCPPVYRLLGGYRT